jgi:hypothetical protein
MLQNCATLDRLFFYGGPDPGPPPAGVEQVRFPTPDGLMLHGWWTPAAVRPEEVLGTVVHAHGNAMAVDNHYEISAFLADYGFNVLIFDYRGYGRSEGRIRRRQCALTDVHAALAYARNRPDVDADRLALLGHSIGGALSLMAGPDEPKLAAIVAISPFSSWRGVAANVVGGGEPPNRFGRGVAWICVREGIEPIERLAEIDCSVLLVHGTRDEIVPHAHSSALLRAGEEAGADIALRSIEGGDHNNLPINEPPLAEEIAAWLARALAVVDESETAAVGASADAEAADAG